jgi:HTH-type transcriptional regulator, sugar sensing transcriptional regulator
MMDKGADFVTRLISFGLSEKEAQVYLHLLKYGPKTPSPLAKSLKTYREDVHRTLTSLIEKGMVRPSLDSPTIYTAADLDNALESAVRKHESELREMEVRKRELQELAKEERFRPLEEVSTFKILKSVKDVMTVALSALTSAEKEWIAIVPPLATVLSSLFVIEDDKEFIDRGGRIRFITDITYPMIEIIREHLDAGLEVRHFDQYSGLLFFVFDGKICMSAINVAGLKRASLSELVSVLWTDDPAYAQYLVSTFEMVWQQSIPAGERIQELLKQGPPQLDV